MGLNGGKGGIPEPLILLGKSISIQRPARLGHPRRNKKVRRSEKLRSAANPLICLKCAGWKKLRTKLADCAGFREYRPREINTGPNRVAAVRRFTRKGPEFLGYFQVIPGLRGSWEVYLVEGSRHSENHSLDIIYWFWSASAKSLSTRWTGEGGKQLNSALANQRHSAL